MRCEGCSGDRCEDALDRCLELDNRCEGCRLTSGSVRILVEATDESEDEASNGGRDPSDSGGLSGKAASEEEILEAFKVRRGGGGLARRLCARECRVAMLAARTAVR